MSATTIGREDRRAANALSARARQRRIGSAVGWGLTGACFALLSTAMVWIIAVVVWRGLGAMRLSLFTEITQGTGGGLLNAIEGTAVLSVGALLLAVPIGVAAGAYVAEHSHTAWARITQFLSDVLVGMPSIVLGYFGYVAMVQDLGWHFSVAAASIVLALICLPYICRTTELSLGQVPNELREAAYALGASEARVLFRITLPAAISGVMTGVLLSLAISVGETAPLLYTAGWSNYLWNGHLTHTPIGYLTYAIWTFINEPFAAANALAYAAALLVTTFVLLINIVSRTILMRRR